MDLPAVNVECFNSLLKFIKLLSSIHKVLSFPLVPNKARFNKVNVFLWKILLKKYEMQTTAATFSPIEKYKKLLVLFA